MTPSLMEVGSMTDLSPAAQAVLDAANGRSSYGPDDCLSESRWIAAAALRAAASELGYVITHNRGRKSRSISPKELLAIADELEGVTYGTYRSDLTDRPQ